MGNPDCSRANQNVLSDFAIYNKYPVQWCMCSLDAKEVVAASLLLELIGKLQTLVLNKTRFLR